MTVPATIPRAARIGADALRHSVRIEDVVAASGRTIAATSREHELRSSCLSPEHVPDRNPSLRIDTRKQVAYCDACGWGGDVFTVIRAWRRCSFTQAVAALASLRWTLRPARILPYDPRSAPERSTSSRVRGQWAHYTYYDADWTLLYEKVRRPDKGFFYRRPLPNGEWVTGLGDVQPVLYRLPSLAGLPFVLVVEGEKDVDAAWANDLPATTNPEGAGNGKWKSRYSQSLASGGIERVYVIPDNDAVGRLHAGQIVASCRSARLRAWLLELPDLPPHGDLSDFFEMGNTRRDLLRLMKAVRA
jgi:hypothetical protein